MSTMTGAAPFATLSAPLPVPRRYTLLDAARLIEGTEDTERWDAGAFVEAYPSGEPLAFDPCFSGSFRDKDIVGVFAKPIANVFTAYLAATCTTSSIGASDDWFRTRLQAAFRANEATAVERVLVAGIPGTLNAHLGDAQLEVLGGGPVSPVNGLALLEDAIAAHGNGLIHAAPKTATYWAALYLIEAGSDGQMRTRLGTVVAVGAGYRDADPDDAATPSATQEWAFASGPVEVRRGEDFFTATTRAEAVDRQTNDELQIIERNYLLSWVGRQDSMDDSFIQAGVLITHPA